MLLFVLSFVAGVLTVLAPCILPLLPVIVGGSIGAAGDPASKRKVFVIVASLGLSVIAFTLLLKASTAFISIPPSFWTWLSGGIVFFFGATLLFPGLWERLPFIAKLSSGSNQLVSAGYQKKSLWGNILIGAALGPVFSTCSPTYFIVLATVLPEQPVIGLLYLFAYAAGLCLMLLLVGLLGQTFADKLGFAADPRGTFKRGLGVVFIIVGLIIISGYDKKIQIQLLEWGIYDITKVEQWLLQNNESSSEVPASALPQATVFDEAMRVAQKEQLYPRAPEIQMPAGYVNTGGEPITIGEFKGKSVVLLDIWTYSCINCQRTIPYLKAWDEKYREMGLQIIGIHTPEFAFEKDIRNVEWAVQQFGIKYPSVLDNDYATWQALGNNYWPRKYLVDIDGFIVYDHIGEGAYEETEAAIQRALDERATVLGAQLSMDDAIVAASIPEANLGGVGSPEIYFGAWRNDLLGNGNPGAEGVRQFIAPEKPVRNMLYLDGSWNIMREYAETNATGKIIFKYRARDVYMVAASAAPVKMRILRDGKPVDGFRGADVGEDGFVTVQEQRLYKLVHDENVGEHVLEIEIQGAGLQAYTFTFG